MNADIMQAEEADRETIFNLLNAFQLSTADFRVADIAHHSALVQAAAMIFAGTIYGQAVASGIEENDRRRRKALQKVIIRNFESGVDIALRQTSRVVSEMGSMQ